MKLKDILLILAFVAAAVLFFLLGRDSAPAVPAPVVSSGQAAIDSLQQLRRDDSLTIERQDAIIVAFFEKSRVLGDSARQASARADRYVSLYHKARADKDTVMSFVSCDSLSSEYEVYREATEQYIAQSDSAVGALYVLNKDLQVSNEKQAVALSELDSSNAMLFGQNIKLAEDNARLHKGRSFWRNVSLAFGAAIAAMAALK